MVVMVGCWAMAEMPNISMHMAGASIPHAMQFLRSLRPAVNRIKLFRVFMVFSFREADSRQRRRSCLACDDHRLLPHRANRKIQAGRIIDLSFFECNRRAMSTCLAR